MRHQGLVVPASPLLRALAGFALLAVTALLFVAVAQADAQAAMAGGGAALQLYGLAVLLVAAILLDIAWFSAVVRRQALPAPPAAALGRGLVGKIF